MTEKTSGEHAPGCPFSHLSDACVCNNPEAVQTSVAAAVEGCLPADHCAIVVILGPREVSFAKCEGDKASAQIRDLAQKTERRLVPPQAGGWRKWRRN